ncbi:hypothetical protein MJH12_18100 [bacterium]|nr:hypothetical protein [bacterium]
MEKIINSLNSDDPKIRMQGILSLKDKNDEEFVLLLIESLEDECAEVATEALNILKSQGDLVLGSLIKAFQHSTEDIRQKISKILLTVAGDMVPALIEQAKEDSEDIQFWISEVLPHFGALSLASLIELSNSEIMPKKLCAIKALGKMDCLEAVAPLMKQLRDEEWMIRKESAVSILALSKYSLTQVLELTKSTEFDLQFWAIQILGKIDKKEARLSLKEMALNRETKVGHKQALITIFRNLDSIDFVAPLIEMFSDENWFIRKQAAEAIWEIGPESESDLVLALEHKDKNIRYWSVRVLGNLQSQYQSDKLLKI